MINISTGKRSRPVCSSHVAHIPDWETIGLGLITGTCELCGKKLGNDGGSYTWVPREMLDELRQREARKIDLSTVDASRVKAICFDNGVQIEQWRDTEVWSITSPRKGWARWHPKYGWAADPWEPWVMFPFEGAVRIAQEMKL